MQSHLLKVHECLTVPCLLHFWQNGQDLLHATAEHGGGMDTEIRIQKVDPGEENVPATPTRPFSHESGALPLNYPQSLFSPI